MTEIVQYKLNLPIEIDRWVKSESVRACRSKSAQIIFLLQEKMQTTAGQMALETSPTVVEQNTALAGGISTNG